MSDHVIEVRELTAGHGGVETVRGVSFTVARGTVYALLGGYRSGKTTLLETVAGCRRPMSGTVRVMGADPYAPSERLPVGTVWREGGLFPGLTVAEVVDAWRRWTVNPLDRDEVLGLVGLDRRAGTRFERLGPAGLRRLDLALALVGRAEVLLLDEPTAGLPATDAHAIRGLLRDLAGAGVTILLATRDLDEACAADRVGVLEEGRLTIGRASGSLRAA
ncbi:MULTISPECIES: ATP-binding cassette domain-containing protein [Thermomonospora]|uniref:ABC transporter related protein n=1 Tax=Thermomonospora curvata (strain ATCC 19995 / DSM 43183 / JCM 3096 / KCTC 9072 / NBRC 15933 / NCIMB 10081 / Henssen B9) TaxID=471852 RepID=D1ABG0_THECD|nr:MULTISPECIES: ATP-binding cassette domain-containing protein [Thermomonospora]ACY97196.1 ABC transporter related protein [Thermomonospora curvata DSM 43183]PKK15051.1 MAG: ABC transporter [Thermomonospora sp. CIF 1]